MDLDSRSGGCRVMDLGWCVSCDGSGFGGGVSGSVGVIAIGNCNH